MNTSHGGTRAPRMSPLALPGPLAFWDKRPAVALVLRCTLAVGIAWMLIIHMPAPLNAYPAYAPMGAIIATASNPTSSVATALRTVGAIFVGATIAVALHPFGPANSIWVIMAGVAVGMVLSELRIFGREGSWVPTAALFTLLFGGGEFDYLVLYSGVVLIGAIVAIGVTSVTPTQPLVPAYESLHELRTRLGARTRRLSLAVGDPEAPTDVEAGYESGVREAVDAARKHVREAERAAIGNPRIRSRCGELEAARRQLTAWEQAVITLDLVEEALASRREASSSPQAVAETVDVLDTFADVVEASGRRVNSELVDVCLEKAATLETGSAIGRDAGSGLPATITVALPRCLLPLTEGIA